MNGNKRYWLNEAYRNLLLALIGCRDKTREHIREAIKCLEKYEHDNKNEKN